MSDLSLFGDKRMTVKEVAEALGTAESTIRNKAAELFPESVKNGVATLLDEKQVYEIKTNLVPRDLTLKSKLEDAEMALDIEMMTIKVIAYHKAEADRLRAALAVATPKAELADRLTSSSDAIDLGTVARVLALPYGRNTLFSILRGKKILMADNRPYQEYMDRGYFRVIEEAFEVNGKTKVSFKTLVYQKGVEYLSKILKEADK